MVVYIECRAPDDPSDVRFGSGVLVSPAGHVLTARHVAPDGYHCAGAIANRTNPLRGLLRTHHTLTLDSAIDGTILRFAANPGETFSYARYCRVTPDLVGRRLVTKAFHQQSRAEPSTTVGVLSTSIPSETGILETDAMTVKGKSGGPVFLDDTDAIVGIVAGVQFDSSGMPAYFSILVAEVFALPLGPLLEEADDCGGSGDGAPKTGNAIEIAPMSSRSAHYWTYPATSQWVSELVAQTGYRVGITHTEDLPPAGESLSIFSFDLSGLRGQAIGAAELDLTPDDVIGDPFGTLGVFKVEEISLGDMAQVIAAPAWVNSYYLTRRPDGPLDVTLAVRAAVERGARAVQFRLRFSSANLNDINRALAAPDAYLHWTYGPTLTVRPAD